MGRPAKYLTPEARKAAAAERQKAHRERRKAERAALLEQKAETQVFTTRDGRLRLIDALDLAVARIDAELAGMPAETLEHYAARDRLVAERSALKFLHGTIAV